MRYSKDYGLDYLIPFKNQFAYTPSFLKAYSLPEIMVTIAILAILATIAIQGFYHVNKASKEAVARDNLALLNRALLHFNQSVKDIKLPANDHSVTDELTILRTLQWRDANLPGSPYLVETFFGGTSSSDTDFRIRWNGRMFELLRPGTSGEGLKTGLAAPEANAQFSYPDGYKPLDQVLNE